MPKEVLKFATGLGEAVIVGVAEGVIVAVVVGEIVNVTVGVGELLTSGNNDFPHAPINPIHSDSAAIVGISRRA